MWNIGVILVIIFSFVIGVSVGIISAGRLVMKKRKIGRFIIDESDPEKTKYLFVFDVDTEDIPHNDYISIKTEEGKV